MHRAERWHGTLLMGSFWNTFGGKPNVANGVVQPKIVASELDTPILRAQSTWRDLVHCMNRAQAPAAEPQATTLAALQQLVASVSHNAIATALPFTAQTTSTRSAPFGAHARPQYQPPDDAVILDRTLSYPILSLSGGLVSLPLPAVPLLIVFVSAEWVDGENAPGLVHMNEYVTRLKVCSCVENKELRGCGCAQIGRQRWRRRAMRRRRRRRRRRTRRW